jgi:hypothetical protein
VKPDDFIGLLYGRFRQSSAWPSTLALQIEFRASGNVRLWAAAAGRENVVCENGSDGICRVTLRGLRRCPSARDDLSYFARAVSCMADAYIKNGPIELSMTTIAQSIGADSEAQSRLTALFSRDNKFWQSWQGHGREFRGVPHEDIIFFDGVDSLDEIDERLARLDTEQRQIAELHWGTQGAPGRALIPATKDSAPLVPKIPTSLSLRDPRLRAATASDLDELASHIRTGAWKSAAVLAGACLEALLLDLWLRNEDRAKEEWKKKWPDSVGLNELAEGALKHGLISRDIRAFAGAITRARNLVHPLRAAAEPTITPAFVELLLSTLKLLNEELGDDVA